MGCTILLLALINLEESGGVGGEGGRARKTTFKTTLLGFITGKHKNNTVLRNVMATLAAESLREASATKQANKRAIVC